MSVKYVTAVSAAVLVSCLTTSEVPAQGRYNKPEIISRGNGEIEVVFDNGCTVFYNSRGARANDLPACQRNQLAYADKAAESYRLIQERENRDRDNNRNDDRYDDRGPEIIAEGGYVRVEFGNGCTLVYEDSGRRVKTDPACRDRQIRRADDAMAEYRPRPGHGHGHGRPPRIIAENDYVRVEFSNGCTVVYEAYSGKRVKSEPDCGDRQLRQADREFTAYRRDRRY
jgi:hypothetical protein